MSTNAIPIASSSQPPSRYRVIARLGQGGMADVFLAQMAGPSGFSKLAVIKRIRADQSVDDEGQMLRLFLDEARLAARLNHPNVISTFEVGEDLGGQFIAMEFLDGQPLNVILSFLKKHGAPLELGIHLHVINEVLTALQYAHELTDYDRSPLRIVHRDVSPQNIFVLYTGQTKLVDFGVAKASSATQETRSGVLKGKIKYMAPEQAKTKDVDRRADIFAAGILLWEALTRRRFWAGLNDTELLTKLVTAHGFPSPKSVSPDVADSLDRICSRAISASADDRYSTAAEFQGELEVAIAELGLQRTQRDVAKILESTFSKERAAMNDVIERFIRDPPRESTSSLVPLLAQQLSNPLSGSGDRSAGESGGSNPASSSSQAAPLASPVARVEPVASRRALVPWLLGALVAVLGVVAFLKVRPAAVPIAAAPSTPPVSTMPVPLSPAATPVVEDIVINLRADPPAAKLFLDDVEVSNPYVVRHDKDAAPHTVKATATGYLSATQTVSFARDLAVLLALPAAPVAYNPWHGRAPSKPATATPDAPTTPAPTPPSSSRGAAEKPPSSTPPAVTLDTGNPWK